MSEKNLPDRASEFDDEIPTYSPSKANVSKDSATANAYQRAGRVAPQSISPDTTKSKKMGFGHKSASEAAKLEEAAKAKEAAAKVEVRDEAPATTAFAAATDHSAPLASDAPTTSYDPPRDSRYAAYADEDFASGSNEPTTILPAATSAPAEPTQVLDVEPVAAAPVAAVGVAGAVAPPADVATAPAEAAPVIQAKRGTMDFGLLLLRIAMAAYLLLDSLRVFFNLGNGGGLNQLEQDFSSYNAPDILAIGIPALELAAGVFLLFGLLTPVAAAVGTGAMTFMLGHFVFTAESLALFDMPDKVWLGIMLVAGTLTLQFTGPGVISFDISRSWAKRPLYSSWIFAVLSIIGAVALWWFGAGVNPLA